MSPPAATPPSDTWSNILLGGSLAHPDGFQWKVAQLLHFSPGAAATASWVVCVTMLQLTVEKPRSGRKHCTFNSCLQLFFNKMATCHRGPYRSCWQIFARRNIGSHRENMPANTNAKKATSIQAQVVTLARFDQHNYLYSWQVKNEPACNNWLKAFRDFLEGTTHTKLTWTKSLLLQRKVDQPSVRKHFARVAKTLQASEKSRV